MTLVSNYVEATTHSASLIFQTMCLCLRSSKQLFAEKENDSEHVSDPKEEAFNSRRKEEARSRGVA